MPVCQVCGFSDFRLSHFRGGDLSRLFALRYPVRCRECGHRGHVSLLLALGIGRADHIRHANRRKKKLEQKSGAHAG